MIVSIIVWHRIYRIVDTDGAFVENMGFLTYDEAARFAAQRGWDVRG